MCGIAGAIELAANAPRFVEPLEQVVERMSERMVHRGPDGAGLWRSPSARVALAHRRLAIIDLSDGGRQPMSYEDGRYWVTFNGEIYNFKDVRANLSALGHRFRSESDTEVLLAAIAEWGIDEALAHLVGMFAFAVWDERDHVLHLARDRMGEKPLYLGEVSRHLFFASELRAFRAIPGFGRRTSAIAAATYLRDGCVPGGLSVYEGIYKLAAGQIATVRAGNGQRLTESWLRPQETNDQRELGARNYWSCAEAAKNARVCPLLDEKAAVEQGETILREAVRTQMHADVPTGAFLSGGIDSCLVTALMQSQSTQPVRTFTVAFDDPRYDESRHAGAIASHLGTHHEEFLLREKDIVDQVPSIMSLMDEPTANGSFFPVHLISRLARNRVTVALSGDGGDELFGGYNRYPLARSAWTWTRCIPGILRPVAARMLAESGSGDGRSRLLDTVGRFGSQVGSADARRKLASVLKSRTFADAYLRLTACWSEQELVAEHLQLPPRHWPELTDVVSSMLLADQLDYLPDDNLAKLDRASMAASLETRLPLLDHRIVEFSWQLPTRLKLRGRTTKWLLRAVLDRYLPRALTERPKMGFSVPTDRWLRGPLREWAEEMLRCSQFRDLFPMQHAAARRAWEEYLGGRGPSSYQAWALVMLSAWAHSGAAGK